METFPSYSATVSASHDLIIPLPTSPVDHMMYLVEIDATSDLTVTIPTDVLLTVGTAPSTHLYAGKTGFFGFRYSSTAGKWFLLSASSQL